MRARSILGVIWIWAMTRTRTRLDQLLLSCTPRWEHESLSEAIWSLVRSEWHTTSSSHSRRRRLLLTPTVMQQPCARYLLVDLVAHAYVDVYAIVDVNQSTAPV